MNRAQAQYKMRQPRHCKLGGEISRAAIEDGEWETWYYVEEDGLSILVRHAGHGTACVKLTTKQLEQALALQAYTARGRPKAALTTK